MTLKKNKNAALHLHDEEVDEREQLSPELLTPEQKALLIQLVNFALQRKIGPMLIPIPAGRMAYVLYVYGEASLRIDRLSDLDALCGAGCLDFRLNRMGNGKVYILNKNAYHQADSWRQSPAPMEEFNDVAEKINLSGNEPTKEMLYNRWADLQQRLHPGIPVEIRERLAWVMDEMAFSLPGKSRISFQLRRIGRYFAENLHDRHSAQLLRAFGHWVQAIYDRLEKQS